MQQNNPQTFQSLSQNKQPSIEYIVALNYDTEYEALYLNACYRFKQVLSYQDWKHIQVLQLRYSKVTGPDIKNISMKKWPNLASVSLNSNLIGSEGAKHLIKANIPQLGILELSNCRIGNEGVKHLSKGNWPNLRKLDLRSNMISNEVFMILSQTNWAKIHTVYTEHQVSDEIALLNLCVMEAGQDIDVPFVVASQRMFFNVINTIRVKFPLFYTKWL